MYYMCIYTCTYKEREGGEGERDTTSTCSCIHCRVYHSCWGRFSGILTSLIIIFPIIIIVFHHAALLVLGQSPSNSY